MTVSKSSGSMGLLSSASTARRRATGVVRRIAPDGEDGVVEVGQGDVPSSKIRLAVSRKHFRFWASTISISKTQSGSGTSWFEVS